MSLSNEGARGNVRIDKSEVDVERSLALKKSRSGYLANLTRTYHEIETLMLDVNNINEVKQCSKKLNVAFDKFYNAHKAYCEIINDNVELNENMETQIKGKGEFEERLEDWLCRANKQNLDKQSVRLGDSASPKGSIASSISGMTRCSRSSSRLIDAKSKQAVAILKANQLQQKQQLQRESQEMARRQENLAAQNEIAIAALESQIWQEAVEQEQSGRCSIDLNYPEIDAASYQRSLQEQGKHEVGKQIHDVKLESDIGESKSKLNPRAPDWSNSTTEPKVNDVNDDGHSLQNIGQLVKLQQEAYQSMSSVLRDGFNMPKTELLTFDGNPVSYWKFVNNFDTNVAARAIDERVKLTYLIQYCTGEAKESIEDCVVLEPSLGYKKAREILQRRYGKPHVIAQSYMTQLVNGPALKPSDGTSLAKLALQMQKCEMTLTQMGYTAEMNNSNNMLKLVRRLPTYLRGKWACKADEILETGREPTFSHLNTFIEVQARIANTMYGQDVGTSVERPFPGRTWKQNENKRATTLATQNGTITKGCDDAEQPRNGEYDKPYQDQKPRCQFCGGPHALLVCTQFNKKTVDERRRLVRDKRLCDNCFQYGHFANGCMLRGACTAEGCYRKHQTLLHVTVKPYNQNGSKDRNRYEKYDRSQNVETQKRGHCAATGVGNRRVCLKIVPVRVQVEGLETMVETYALLDDCSDVSLCDKSLIQRLGVKGVEKNFTLTTVNKESSSMKGIEVNLIVKSLSDDETVSVENVLSVDKLPISERSIPKMEDTKIWPHLAGLEFPNIEEENVTLLIGSDVPEAFWTLDERRGRRKEPYAVRTLLGWTLVGPTGVSQCDPQGYRVNYLSNEDELLDQQIEKFWKTDFNDSLQDNKLALSVEDKRALATMEKTNEMVDGHYQLGLPWRYQPPCLPRNRVMAEARLQSLKKRLQKDERLLGKYKATIGDYIAKGYARRVPEAQMNEENIPIWYLPHHPVVNPHKPEKLRVVFDCAAKCHGTSLNDQLLQGPDMTNSLVGVLIRFRQEPIALVADIEGMFHQVRVSPSDRSALRFLWWSDGDLSKEPDEYQMCVHLFGATSSPSCASFALRKTADDNKDSYDPAVIEAVYRNFYVDDCLKSVRTESDAIRLVGQLLDLLSRGGFRLTKWVSNSKNIMTTIPEEERATSVSIDLDHLPIERTLGVRWNVESDKFEFDVVLKDKPYTRRGILSMVSSIYDPLGFVAPSILPAKKLLQELCRLKLKWDEPIPEMYVKCWKEWISGLDELSNLHVDRCLKSEDLGEIVLVQLHHFTDASQVGYGAVSYLRFVDAKGKIHCTFVMGKSRLTPLKPVTIPRLELTAAVVAAKLDKMIKYELDIPVHETMFWTDSTSVLQYIRNETRRFQTFVANRIAVIHENSTPSQWRHVDTRSNPADMASRGLRCDQVEQMQTWLHGPKFLSMGQEHWPVHPVSLPVLDPDDNELKKEVKVSFVTEVRGLNALVEHYSDWYSLQKGIAWLLRYKTFCKERYLKKNKSVDCSPLSVSELRKAALEAVKYVQKCAFGSDCLSKGQFGKLSPVMDDGVLRVGGRLERADIHFSAKHQAILPGKHHLTSLIIRHYHKLAGHSGAEYVLSSIRQKYWIPKGRAAIRKELGKCFECRKRNSARGEQFMAPLPVERITADKPPFTYVGIDYFGPLSVKQGRSVVKRYGCIFTCLTTRAVHLEIAFSLDTSSFINALQRFMSRRGRPDKIFSDNGTNFKGGERELRMAIQEWNQQKIHDFLRQREIEWKFNPPAASHMGGVWERLIRSVRRILKALLKEQLVNDETLLTLIVEVEKILNDRPLTCPSDDPKDFEVLTPNTILLMRANSCLPPGIFKQEEKYCNRRWRQAQYLSNVFWRRWIKEYLPTLQIRQKWSKQRRNFKVSDLVLVVNDMVPRGQWPLGRVEEVFADSNGYVRSVKVRTATSLLVRPIVKLCLLEGAENQDEQLPDVNASLGDSGNGVKPVSAEVGEIVASNPGTVSEHSCKSVLPAIPKRISRKPLYLKDYLEY